MAQALRYYVYYSCQMIGQLYRQLPESRQVAQRSSLNRHERAETVIHLHGEGQPRPPMPHVGLDCSGSRFSEAAFDKNDMYQLERVLCALRGAGQMHKEQESCCAGEYVAIKGCFVPDMEREAPEGSLWLAAQGVRLLCAAQAFCGETEEAWQALWACGDALPLEGVALCLGRREGSLCGTPLYLAV